MIGSVLMIALAVPCQDKAKTVEARIKELEARLSALEDRAAKARKENDDLQKRSTAVRKARENYIKRRAASWVGRYAKPAGLDEEKRARLEARWVAWLKADMSRPKAVALRSTNDPSYFLTVQGGNAPDAKRWQDREAELRKELSKEEADRIAAVVRRDQEKTAKGMIGSFVRTAEIAPERAGAFEKTIMGTLAFADDVLLPSAHPPSQVHWMKVYRAVEKAEPDLVLSGAERTRLQEALKKWKPRSVRLQGTAVQRKEDK